MTDPTRATPSTAQFLNAHRDELRYQARLLRGVPAWYLGPLVPGMALFLVGTALEGRTVPALTVGSVVAVAFVGIAVLNRAAARRLDRLAERVPRLQD